MNAKSNLKNNLFALGLSFLGAIFLVYYIFRASVDVVSSDYIRIINYYLPDTTNLKLLLSWEGISRIPFTFLARHINVNLFHYSVYFDKIIGISGLFLFNFILVKFILNTFKSKLIRTISSILATIFSFSLISWEMILNGTGYPHFMTIGLVALVFYLFDRIVKRTKCVMTLETIDSSDLRYYGNASESNRLSNMISLIDTSEIQRKNLSAHLFVYLLLVITSLIFGGSYSVAFLCTIIFFSIVEIFVFISIRNKYNRGEIDSFEKNNALYKEFKEQFNSEELRSFGLNKGEKYSTVNNETTFKIIIKFIMAIIISLVCLMCFFKSNATGEPLIPVGVKDVTLPDVLRYNPIFVMNFFLKSLASAIFGTETFSYAINFGTITERMIYAVGILYVVVMLFTLFVIIVGIVKSKNKDRNIFDINDYNQVFPYMFIVYGAANFILVFLARYNFVRDTYGMSSRYAIQYMFLTIGIFLILMMFIDDIIFRKKYIIESDPGKGLSKSYQKRREKLISEGKIVLEPPKYSIFNIVLIVLTILSISFFTIGSLTTTMDEIFKSDYRKIVYDKLMRKALDYESLTDDELMDSFEYHRNAEHIKRALKILKENNLNIFYKK